MSNNSIDGDRLFLTAEDRKPVEESEVAVKSQVESTPNLALYEENGELNEVVAHVLKEAIGAKSRYEMSRQSLWPKWQKADNCYWMLENQSDLPELSNAKVAASTFYRSARRLSDGAYLTTFEGDELPVKYFPAIDPHDPTEVKAVKAAKADAVNKLAKQYFEKQRIKQDTTKAKRAYHQCYKYSTVIAYVPYDYQVEKRYRYEDKNQNQIVQGSDGSIAYKHIDTGELSPRPHPPKSVPVEYDYVCKDETGFYTLPIQNVWLDDRIEDLNRQPAFLWRSDINRPEIWKEGMAGRFKNIEKITQAQRYQLYGYENEIENDRRQDAGKDVTSSSETELYARWQCWLIIPKIKVTKNKKGEPTKLEWDQNASPRRYLLETIGELGSQPVVVRFQESPYWSNNIPFIAAHSHDDDSGFWNRGLVDLLRDNYNQESVTKGQLMDNRTLLLRRPQVWLKGRVQNKSGKIDHNTIFTVTSPGAIEQLEISDFTGTISQSLHELREESEAIAQTPKFMIGQGIGSRTSATEFAAIRDSGAAPALTDIKVLNMQLWGGYMKKVLEYIPQFVDHQIVVTSEGEKYLVEPGSLKEHEMDLREVAIQEFDNKQTTRQIITNLVGGVLSNPMFQGMINPAALAVRIFSLYPEFVPNPEELLIKDPMVAQLLKMWNEQKLIEQQPGEASQMIPGQPVGVTESQPLAGVAGQMSGM